MSDTLWLQIKDGSEVTGGDWDLTSMLRVERALEALASRCSVVPLSRFYDHSELATDLGAGSRDAQPSWSPAAEGLATVEALLGQYRATPEVITSVAGKGAQDTAYLGEELEHCRERLVEATARGATFRLLVVP